MDEIEKIAIGTIFAILQALILGVIAAAVKTYWNVRTLKRDMNEAFRMIRAVGGTQRSAHGDGKRFPAADDDIQEDFKL